MTARKATTDWFNWFEIGMDLWAMQLEASQVIALRMARAAGGGTLAARENERMVSEKLMLQWELAMRAWSGSLGQTPEATARTAVRRTRTKIKANRTRLTRR